MVFFAASISSTGAADSIAGSGESTGATTSPRVGVTFEDLMGVEHVLRDDSEQLLNAAKFALVLEASARERIRISARAIAKHYGASSTSGIMYLPDDVFDSLVGPDPATGAPGMDSVLAFNLVDTVYVQQAYATYASTHLEINLGRQLFLPGAGLFLRPNDLFNVNFPGDPSWEPEGHDGAHAGLALHRQVRASAFVEPRARLADSNGTLALSGTIGAWRSTVSLTRHTKTRVDWEALNSTSGLAEYSMSGLQTFKRTFRSHLLALDIQGRISRTKFWAEGALALVHARDDPGTLSRIARDHVRSLLGVAHEVAGFRTVLEYAYQGDGRRQPRDLSLDDRLAALFGEVQNATAHNAFLVVSMRLGKQLELGARDSFAMGKPYSTVVNPFVSWRPAKGVSAEVFGAVPIGSKSGAAGNVGSGLFLHLKFEWPDGLVAHQ